MLSVFFFFLSFWSDELTKYTSSFSVIMSSISCGHIYKVGDTRGAMAPHFVWQKKKEWKRISKQKLLKGCHQGKNVTVLVILESLEFKYFSCWSTMVASITCKCSMAPPLWNPFCRPCYKVFNSNDLILSFYILPLLHSWPEKRQQQT